jgi:hypothetical protein
MYAGQPLERALCRSSSLNSEDGLFGAAVAACGSTITPPHRNPEKVARIREVAAGQSAARQITFL